MLSSMRLTSVPVAESAAAAVSRLVRRPVQSEIRPVKEELK